MPSRAAGQRVEVALAIVAATRPPRPTGAVPPMFRRWGAFTYRFRRPIVVLAVLLAVGSAFLATQVTGSLSAGGWSDPNSESVAVADRLKNEFGASGGSIVAVFQGDAGADARSPAFQAEIATALQRLVADDRVD